MKFHVIAQWMTDEDKVKAREFCELLIAGGHLPDRAQLPSGAYVFGGPYYNQRPDGSFEKVYLHTASRSSICKLER